MYYIYLVSNGTYMLTKSTTVCMLVTRIVLVTSWRDNVTKVTYKIKETLP